MRPAKQKAASTKRGPSVKAQATEGFFLHCLTFIQLTAITARVLGNAGFSLTGHRILGLATLTPGITVGQVVSRLRLTHQAVNGPLRQLIKAGYVVAKIGVEDRRHRRMFATRKGSHRYLRVLVQNVAKLEHAFRAAGPEAVRGFLEVHHRLVDPGDRQWVEQASRFVEENELDI
jgi:DNA-binding MarR family transcriptional regulator